MSQDQSDRHPTGRARNLAEVQRRLGVTFPSTALLDVALTHPSFLGESHREDAESNQRLEFLGDSLLGLAVSEYLYQRYPELPEGELTKIKATVVSAPVLYEAAKSLSLGDHILMGRGEEASGGRNRPSVLADALEAVIGAILVEVGTEAARQFVLRQLADAIETQGNAAGRQDHKSRLQEITQGRSLGTPAYTVMRERGPDHQKTFEVEVRVGNEGLGRGMGGSKKEAEQQAAESAVGKLDAEPPAPSSRERRQS